MKKSLDEVPENFVPEVEAEHAATWVAEHISEFFRAMTGGSLARKKPKRETFQEECLPNMLANKFFSTSFDNKLQNIQKPLSTFVPKNKELLLRATEELVLEEVTADARIEGVSDRRA